MFTKKQLEKLSIWATILGFPIAVLSFAISTYFAILAYNISKEQADDKSSINLLTKLAQENKAQTDTLIVLLNTARIQNEQYKNHLELAQKEINYRNRTSFAEGIGFYTKYSTEFGLNKARKLEKNERIVFLQKQITILEEGLKSAYWSQKDNFTDCVSNLIFHLEAYIKRLKQDSDYNFTYYTKGKKIIIYSLNEDDKNWNELGVSENCLNEIFYQDSKSKKRFLEEY